MAGSCETSINHGNRKPESITKNNKKMEKRGKSRIEKEAIKELRSEFRENDEITTDVIGIVLNLETGEEEVTGLFRQKVPLSMRGSVMAPFRNGMRIYRFAYAAEKNRHRPLELALVDIASSEEGENDLVKLTFFDFRNPSAEQRTVYYNIVFGEYEVDC
jgi:hypothetical protein